MTASTTAAPIEFDGLVKRFGKRTVLDNLTFSVPEGTVVGLLGPNGAGKSTAMRVLLGLQKASGGRAAILGHEPGSSGFRSATRKVGTIIEAPPLYKNATALQNLAIRVTSMGVSMNDAEVREILNRVGLAERADDKAGDFSLGMRQRVGIALALVGDPSIVVLDEPTNGLDPEGTVEIRDLVRSLPERGATTLLCTHRLAEVEATCDYVVLLQKGHLVTQGSIDEVIASATAGGVAVRVAPDDIESAMRVMRGLGLGDVAFADGAITTTTTPEDPATVTRALAEQGIFLRGLEVHRASLEEAFLALTRKHEEASA
jgi:ABC-type multidrug transport system ATPase subunit